MSINSDTSDNKKRFIQLYKAPESGGNISTVCSAIGIARDTYYNWLEVDEEFRKQMYDAKMEKCDEMEQALYQRGFEKSDTALIYWLKNNHPTYKENEIASTGGLHYHQHLENQNKKYELQSGD